MRWSTFLVVNVLQESFCFVGSLLFIIIKGKASQKRILHNRNLEIAKRKREIWFKAMMITRRRNTSTSSLRPVRRLVFRSPGTSFFFSRIYSLIIFSFLNYFNSELSWMINLVSLFMIINDSFEGPWENDSHFAGSTF